MKKKFLRELAYYLSPLSKEERDEILRFYEERFYTSMMYEGKSEDEVLDELESPRQIARNVLDEYGYSTKLPVFQPKQVQSQKEAYYKNDQDEKHTNQSPSLVSILLLIGFDVIILTGLVGGLIGLFFGLAGGLFAFMAGTLIDPLISGTSSDVYYTLLILGISYLWFLLILWIYDVIIGFFSWLVRIHINTFKVNVGKNIPKSIKRFSIGYNIKKRPALRKTKSLVSFVVVIVIFFSGFMLITAGSFSLEDLNYQTIDFEETKTISETPVDPWSINTNVDFGEIMIVRTSSNVIRVHGTTLEDYPHEITIDETNQAITITNEFDELISFRLIFNLFTQTPSITIEIPETVDISTIDIKGTNGKINIADFSLDNLNIESTNALVKLDDLTVVIRVTVDTTNGDIVLNRVQANSIDLKTTNGRFTLNEVDAFEYDLTTTNGEIRLESLNETLKDGVRLVASTTNGRIEAYDVYVKDVDFSTTNGNIVYRNSDLTFILDTFEHQQTNGSLDVNIPVQ
ncbi:MAG: DUF4097 family beta strand repeat-containing protein [Candidatus Izemoplasmataceae bacterium]